MPATLHDLFVHALVAVILAARALAWPALFFGALALLLKGRAVVAHALRALPQTRTTLAIMAVNVTLTVPAIALIVAGLAAGFEAAGLRLAPPRLWDGLPAPLVVLAAVFVGDFAGYWRHRLEHGRLLWPSHAVHHSDDAMTWLALQRFHPINFVTTATLDTAALLLLGLPPYAIVANNLVRHYYGYFIHADLPWTYGRLGKVFVSPAMHRWHHAADPAAYGTNFATVFALLDRAFGTWRVPGPCTAPLGVTDDMGPGALGQLAWPLRPRAYSRPAGERPAAERGNAVQR